MLRTLCGRSNERNIDFTFNSGRKLYLCFFCRLIQALQGKLISTHIHAGSFLEFFSYPINNLVVNITSTQVAVAIGRLHFYDIITYFKHRHVKGSATEIVNHNFFIFLFIKSISKRRSRRFIDDTLHIQPGNLSRILCGFSLRIVEIRRHGDHRFSNFFPELGFHV